VPHYQVDSARVAGFRAPTLLLIGSESPPFFRAAIEALHTALPASELVILDGQHHNAMETAPDLFTMTVNQFLRKARDDA
jgi:pimeloyl-ACP methyl ester carboxylesterase